MFISVQYLCHHKRVLWQMIPRTCSSSLSVSFLSVSPRETLGHATLCLHRASRSSHQHGHFQHRPTLRHPAVQTWLRWQDVHLTLAGGSPGELFGDVRRLALKRSHMLPCLRVSDALCCLGLRWVWWEKTRTGCWSTGCLMSLRPAP